LSKNKHLLFHLLTNIHRLRRNPAQGNLKKLVVMPHVLTGQVKNIKNAAAIEREYVMIVQNIEEIEFCFGMLESWESASDLPVITLDGKDIPEDIIEAIAENDILELGVYTVRKVSARLSNMKI